MSAQGNLHPDQFGEFQPEKANWGVSALGFGRARENDIPMWNTPDEAHEQAAVHQGMMAGNTDRPPGGTHELSNFVPYPTRKASGGLN